MHPGRLSTAFFRVCAVASVAALAGSAVSCKRHHASDRARSSEPSPAASAPAPQQSTKLNAWTKGAPREVLATWYEVPSASLPKRRAGLEEFTAAHNHLPIGTLVRVTHLANGKSVRVRITDRGHFQPGVKLDLCKEAAAELEMVGQGIARVRLEVLEESGGSPPDTATVAAQP